MPKSAFDGEVGLRCSFCRKSESEVKKLISGTEAFICDECIQTCNEILSDEFKHEDLAVLPKPSKINEALDDYVISQEEAKKVLAVAVYNHYKRVKAKKGLKAVDLEKSNILLVGPTGCGKTFLAKTLAKILQVPFAIADATSITEAGYVGENAEDILLRLLENADFDEEKASQGIVYVDEIDKIAKKTVNSLNGRDISGEGVQQSLLKMMEGAKIHLHPKGAKGQFQKIDTTDILFVCGGTFVDLDRIIEKRIFNNTMGFARDLREKEKGRDDLMRRVRNEDLIEFGMIPEFVGRLPVVAILDELDQSNLISILTEPKNALAKQYRTLFELEGVQLRFTDECLVAVAKKAIERKSGARGLRTILEKALIDVMYKIPDHGDIVECIVTPLVIEGKEEPIYLYRERKESSLMS